MRELINLIKHIFYRKRKEASTSLQLWTRCGSIRPAKYYRGTSGEINLDR